MKKYLLRGFSILGILLFFPLFLFTFANPHTVEQSAKGFVEWKLKNELNNKIDSIELPHSPTLEKLLGAKAKALSKKANIKLATYKKMLKDDIPNIMLNQLAKVHNLDCECRQKWKNRLNKFIKFEITTAQKAKIALANFMQAKYMEIVEKLTLDVRIFLGLNTLVFIFLLLVSFIKPQAIEHLFVPGLLLLVSTIVSSYFYILEQDWFYTILYNDYIGFGYLIYLLIIFAILCDIIFNKARITTNILNMFFNAIGSALNASPC